ncbi:hypothetical protein F1737_03590 [Methanoplanus sp. FWC-SCC4]|uniref:Uncharacterized protein n=1 Tax=Methanochimaera problematica TaxID=2609417 RepID=A0AA97I415_9EURY|nr:hypothetical protein [Methanoplanus sp. FWC-SCC4]WOF15841.1 hypothetical protein F1737_03590 [Methanoplanus sp. FWC-SCC4]
MISKRILEDEETFSLLIQLTDVAAAAHERGDYDTRDKALEEIKEIRKQIIGQVTEGTCKSE